ncbi:hypothetical protein [Sneathiella litorea]|uniref:Glycerophosphoryl diester phosphodiesterase membrane domain-containing protein n=1 Tax=Sneathiella litorea TaxID=2606216 RepID=A0A6L8WA66_9PROT|nr:hypothetical protein [Sneathiella litorea]MZR31998.1 hypothetical protein [Sneathiella litorea]
MSENQQNGVPLLMVPKAILAAGAFVFENVGACLRRGLPIFLVALLIEIGLGVLTTDFSIALQLINIILFSIFAVSWHRYTLLPAERGRKALALGFGLREIKFAGLGVGTAVIALAVFFAFTALLKSGAGAIISLLLMLPVYMTVLFMYPAIALDQPINLGLFLKKGMSLIVSYVIAVVMVVLILIAPMAILYFAMNLITDIIDQSIVAMVILLLVNLLISIFFVAILVSTASFLYRDVIGMEEMQNG